MWKIIGSWVIVACLTWIFGDWCVLRMARQGMEEQTRRAIALAEQRGDDTNVCLATLRVCGDELGSQTKRAQLVTLTQFRIASLVQAAQKGDKDAITKLSDLGWSWDPKHRILQASNTDE